MSFDRLIRLSQRTGDRLIVHDPVNGRDVVILGIDAYEGLVFGKDAVSVWEEGGDGVSEEDISNWHSTERVLSDRYGDWNDSMPSISEDGKEAMQDAEEERKDIVEKSNKDGIPDEPVFYEEPIV